MQKQCWQNEARARPRGRGGVTLRGRGNIRDVNFTCTGQPSGGRFVICAGARNGATSMTDLLVSLLLPALASPADEWLIKRHAVLRTIWSDGDLPTARKSPDYSFAANVSGVTWLTWDITGADGKPMNATGWYHPIRPGSRSSTLMLTHEGHDNKMSVDANFSAWVHGTLECDYLHLWMPLYGPNQQHGYPPHHWFFRQWEDEGIRTLRYFLEPTVLATNYGLGRGYKAVHVTGISGGGWTTTVAAAIDPRLAVSLPLAGSLPWYLFPNHQIGDYEQRPQPGVPKWYLSAANFTELYVLAALEPGRVSVQVLHEDDQCCFHGHGRHPAILGYGARVAAALEAAGGGTFASEISDWGVHEWDERSRAIIAAARREAVARPRRPRLDALPCDILHHDASAVPCNTSPGGVTTAAAKAPANGAGFRGGGGGGVARRDGFVHPGVLVSASMLEQLRRDVAGGIEPARSAFAKAKIGQLQRYGDLPPVKVGLLSYVPHPQQLRSDNGTAISIFREDAFAAYTHALLWAVEGDERHARKAMEIMDGWARAWTLPLDLEWGLQIAWAAAVWPRAAEIVRHTFPPGWAGAAAFGAMLSRLVLPMVNEGASTNGNIGLVMTEAAVGIAVFNDDHETFDASVARWRAQAPAYLYVASDGPTPKRPPEQRYLAHTAPTCEPTCNDAQMVTYWHGQAVYGHNGICQESCRDLGHTMLGFSTLVNTAETAFHQGVDLYAEARERMIAAAELHASLFSGQPAPYRQPTPKWLCGGQLKGSNNTAGTFDMLRHHFTDRRGMQLPNVSATLRARGVDRDFCWDHMCWETLTHGSRVV